MLKSATFILKIVAVYNVDFLTSVVILLELRRLHCLWNFYYYYYYLEKHSVLLRACLHGVGDPGLVGLVSFVFTLWGTQNKRNLPH